MTTFYDRYENATVMLSACQEAYARANRVAEAKKIRGLEITDPDSVRLALMLVSSLESTPGELADVREATLAVLRAAAPVPARRLAC